MLAGELAGEDVACPAELDEEDDEGEDVERILVAVPGTMEMIDPPDFPHVSWPDPPHQKLVGFPDPVPELHGYIFAQKGFSMKRRG